MMKSMKRERDILEALEAWDQYWTFLNTQMGDPRTVAYWKGMANFTDRELTDSEFYDWLDNYEMGLISRYSEASGITYEQAQEELAARPVRMPRARKGKR